MMYHHAHCYYGWTRKRVGRQCSAPGALSLCCTRERERRVQVGVATLQFPTLGVELFKIRLRTPDNKLVLHPACIYIKAAFTTYTTYTIQLNTCIFFFLIYEGIQPRATKYNSNISIKYSSRSILYTLKYNEPM